MASNGERALALSKLPLATLEATRDKLSSGINAIAEGGQSWAMSGIINRTFTRGQLDQMADLLNDYLLAIEIKNGNVRSRTYVSHNV